MVLWYGAFTLAGGKKKENGVRATLRSVTYFTDGVIMSGCHKGLIWKKKKGKEKKCSHHQRQEEKYASGATNQNMKASISFTSESEKFNLWEKNKQKWHAGCADKWKRYKKTEIKARHYIAGHQWASPLASGATNQSLLRLWAPEVVRMSRDCHRDPPNIRSGLTTEKEIENQAYLLGKQVSNVTTF